MKTEEIKCDRCHNSSIGFVTKFRVSGFFDVTKDEYKKFANPKEKKVCDECMYLDNRFVDYLNGVKI